MGKGDRKTRKGKIYIRSYGNARPHAVKKSVDSAKPVVKKAAPAVKKAAPAKKAAAKKSA